MARIDLTRQAQAPQTASLVLQTGAVTQSTTGLYEPQWDSLSAENIGTGSLNLGSLYTLYVGTISMSGTPSILYDNVGNSAIEFLTTGSVQSGSIKIHGDLLVQGSQSIHNVEQFAVQDPIIDLNFTGSTALASTDSGLRVGRVGSTNAQLVFDHSETRWAIDNAAGSNINIVGVSTTDTLTNKTITSLASSTMGSNADLTFTGDGEVLGLPNSPSANGAATSKYYVDNEITDNVVSTGNTYLRKQFVKTAASITGSNTASFTAVSASAPSGFTATTEHDFIFFINGQYMEHDAVEVEQKTTVLFHLKVNTGSIGYELESDDEIMAWGKFNS